MRDPHPADLQGPAATIAAAESFYSLWDVDTGNSLGTYDTREEALAVARALIEANGSSYADDLDLSVEDVGGDIRHVASGEALLLMVGIDQRAFAD
jgi:hypothetical protein